MTPQQRAAAIVANLHPAVRLKATWTGAVSRDPGIDVSGVSVYGYLPTLQEAIAAAVRDAVAEEREARAALIECLADAVRRVLRDASSGTRGTQSEPLHSLSVDTIGALLSAEAMLECRDREGSRDA